MVSRGNSMHNLYLVGMPGCGKSTLGRQASKELGIEFVDLDSKIVEHAGKSINAIFAESGEAVFRQMETACLREVSEKDNQMVATGGGIILAEKNIAIMKETGKIVFIDVPLDRIIKRTDFRDRPLLKDDTERIYGLYEARYPVYQRCADYILQDTGDLASNISNLCRFL